jgi:polar amino acid transport system substrate-binding protein
MLLLIPINKKYQRNIVDSILKLVIFIMCIFSSAVYSSCDMSLAVESYPPYQTQVEGKWQGLDIELASALAQQIKCELTIKQSPWKRSLNLLQNGRIDMMVSVSKTPKRQDYTYFVGPMRQEIVALVINTGAAIKVTGLADLATLDKKIGIINGAYYGQSFTKKYEKDGQFKDQFEVSNNTQDNLKKLAARRISGFLNDPFYIADLIRKGKVSEPLSFHSFVINQDPVYFGFSKKSISKKRLLQIQQAFEQLQENGKLASIRKKYSSVVL